MPVQCFDLQFLCPGPHLLKQHCPVYTTAVQPRVGLATFLWSEPWGSGTDRTFNVVLSTLLA